MASWLAMGGHGAYIWSAYGISLVVLATLAWHSRRRKLKALEQIGARAPQ